jgi:hypothetical protein
MAKLLLTALKLVAAPGPDNRLYVKAATADNTYVTGGVALDLTPGKITDPSAIGVVGPSVVPLVTPGVFSSSLGGYMATVVPTTGGLSGYKLQFWTSAGSELAAGAYPAAISAGYLALLISYES